MALAVTEEGTREVLGIFNMPIESATGWKERSVPFSVSTAVMSA